MRIIDGFMPLIGYVLYFRNSTGQVQPGFQQVKADVQRLLSQSENSSRSSGCSTEDYDLARFIVCAWVDEMILGSDWSEKGQWQREQLQRIYYNTTDAGVEVYDKLNQLGFHQRDVREVYYYCLSLGFRGRFINHGDEFLLDQLKSSNLKILTGSAVGVPPLDQGELFPEALPVGGGDLLPQPKSRFSPLLLAATLGPVLLFTLLYLVYWFTLGSVGHKLS
jgi:type VI secretion system protein ImpK